MHLVGSSLGGWIAADLAVRNSARLASLTLVGAAGIYVQGVEQVDTFLSSDEQRIRELFYDQELAEAVVCSIGATGAGGRRAEEPRDRREARMAAAQLRSASLQVAAPHQGADAADLGRA